MNIKKFIGNRQFYASVYFVAMPIIVQQVVTNFVSLLDNLMVGRVGTEEMSGVAIVNQLTFIYNIALFGLFAGISIFTAQFYGKQDNDGIRHTMRLSILAGVIYLIVGFSIFYFYGDTFILKYLHEGSSDIDIEKTFFYAKEYLKTIIWGIIPFTFSEVYAGTLKSTKETKVPMIASVSAVIINLSLNYILIYGKFGAPALGVIGAAVATNISRYLECSINVIWTHTHKEKAPFIDGIYKNFYIPKDLIKKIAITAAPLLLNEVLWSTSVTTMNQNFSVRGIEVVSAINISNTASTLFNAFYLSMGISISIMVGNALGSGDPELAVDTDRKMIALSLVLTSIIGVVAYFSSPFIANLYNTQNLVKDLATSFMQILACMMPIEAVVSACYFTMRSGGKTLITFLFDSCWAWIFMVLPSYLLVTYTNLTIVPIFAITYGMMTIKLVIGIILVKKRVWVNNLVN